MKFVLHRNFTLSTVFGHTIQFTKGEPVMVPSDCYAAVIAIGAIPESDLPEAPAGNPNEPADPAERKAKIMSAFESIAAANKRDSFGANGTPKIDAVFEYAGFRPDPRERDALWQEFRIGVDASKTEAEADAKAEAAKPKGKK